jgi:hypothetical protein
VVLTYIGNIEQLHDNMTKNGIDLANDDGAWTIAATPAADDTATPPASPSP